MIQKKYSYRWKKCVGALMLAVITLTGTGVSDLSSVQVSAAEKSDSEKFEEYSQEMFKEYLSSDILTNNMTVIDGTKYGVKDVPACTSKYTDEALKKNAESEKEINRFLDTLSYSSLTKEQQDLYDLMRFETKYSLNAEAYQYYEKAFGAYDGLQTGIITALTSYRFDEQKDFDDYLKVLKSIPQEFEEAVTYEQKRSEKGLFMSDYELDEVLISIKDLTKDSEKNVLITSFNHTVDKFGLNHRDTMRYKKQNHDIVINEIIPAYQKTAQELEKLRGTGIANDTGIWKLPNGKKYYEHLLHHYTGTERSPMEYVEIIDSLCDASLEEMKKLEKPLTENGYKDASEQYYSSKPEKYLELLMKNSEDFVPTLNDVQFNVKYVDESLGTFAAPAYVYVPQIDSFKEFNVNINPAYENSATLSTVAHEGYPGHLYQFTTMNLLNKNPLFHVYQNRGYIESWSKHVEDNSYYFMDCSKLLARYMKLALDYTFMIQIKLDILINYVGYTKEQAMNYLMDLGFPKENSEAYYYHLLEVPAYNLCYAGGYAELQLMIEHAQKELGRKFNMKKFNEFYLSEGACTFETINKRLNEWIAEQL